MRAAVAACALLLTAMTVSTAEAASIYAGQMRAATVCSSCHGVKTPPSDAPFPPLAGRDADYLQTALKQYRDKTRKSDIMNAIAGSMSDDDIANVAAYYSRQKP
jgi:cytochrome c553